MFGIDAFKIAESNYPMSNIQKKTERNRSVFSLCLKFKTNYFFDKYSCIAVAASRLLDILQ